MSETPLALDPLDLEADDLRIALETIAQAWCTTENSHKVMDSDLAEAGAKLFAGWIGIARQHLRNEEYYRGLLDECGQAIGEAAFTQDDGGKSDSVLRAKIPELVRALKKSGVTE